MIYDMTWHDTTRHDTTWRMIWYDMIYYVHSTPPTSFGHTCGQPQGRALQRVYKKKFWTNAQTSDTNFRRMWFRMCMEMWNTDQISLMHGHWLFKAAQLYNQWRWETSKYMLVTFRKWCQLRSIWTAPDLTNKRHRAPKTTPSSTNSSTDATTCQTATDGTVNIVTGQLAALSDVILYVNLCQIMNSDWGFGGAYCFCLQVVAVQQVPEDWDSTFPQNVRTYQPANCTSHQIRRQNPKTRLLRTVGGDDDSEVASL